MAASDVPADGGAAEWFARWVGPWTVRLMVVAVCAQFISSSVRPLITYQTLSAGAGPLQVGLVASAFSVLALFAAIPLGKAIDRHGEVGFLVAGSALVAATLLALLAPSNLVVLGVCSAGLGLGHLAMVASTQTLIAKGATSELRETRFATLTSLNAVAQIMGPAATGFLVGDALASSEGSVHVPGEGLVLAIAISMGIGATLTAASLKLWPGALGRRVASDPPPAHGAFGAVMRLPAVPTAMLASVTVLTCVDLLGAYMPVLGEEHGISPRMIGLLLATEGAAAMVVRLWMLRLIVRFTRRRLLIATMALAATSVSLIPLWVLAPHPLPGLFLSMVLAGLGLGMGQPASMAWVAGQTPPSLRATAVGIRLSGNRLGLVLVPIAAGALASSLGLGVAFWWPAALLLVCAYMVSRTPTEA